MTSTSASGSTTSTSASGSTTAASASGSTTDDDASASGSTTDGDTSATGSTTDAPEPRPAAGTLSAIDRRRALAEGAPGIPHHVIYWVLGAVLVLGVGGALLSRVVTSLGTTSARSASAPLTSGPPIADGATAAPSGVAALHAPLSSLLDVSSLQRAPAPGFTLTDAATGNPVTLASLRGHVVVLSFANAACNDICPVVSAELSQAASLLGRTTVPVTFLTVNTDPLDPVSGSPAAILSQPTLAHLVNWRFLTGTVGQLDSVWVRYGISITAERTHGIASHNELLYFIAPNGDLAWSVVPFGNESKTGAFTLTSDDITRFAQGIADYVQRLEPSP